jgi:hypothetical protein
VTETRYQVPVTKYRQIVFAFKVAAVGVFAVGIEFFTNRELLIALLLWAIAIAMSLWPVRIDITEDEAPKGGDPAAKGQAAMHPLEEI